MVSHRRPSKCLGSCQAARALPSLEEPRISEIQSDNPCQGGRTLQRSESVRLRPRRSRTPANAVPCPKCRCTALHRLRSRRRTWPWLVSTAGVPPLSSQKTAPHRSDECCQLGLSIWFERLWSFEHLHLPRFE